MKSEDLEVDVWLCPLKARNWKIVKKFKMFGVPRRVRKIFRQVKTGDLLLFHVLKPVNGIAAICKVVSPVFESGREIWGKNRYPLRVKIEILSDFDKNGKEPIPLSVLMGETENSEVTIEPYLRNIWITKITREQFRNLQRRSHLCGRSRPGARVA